MFWLNLILLIDVTFSTPTPVYANYRVVLIDNVYTCAASAPTQSIVSAGRKGAIRVREAKETNHEKTVFPTHLFAGCDCIDNFLRRVLGTGQHPHGAVRKGENGPRRKLEGGRQRLCCVGEKRQDLTRDSLSGNRKVDRRNTRSSGIPLSGSNWGSRIRNCSPSRPTKKGSLPALTR